MEGDAEAYMECIGTAAASSWAQWQKSQDLPEPLEILAGTITTVPTRPDSALATACAITSLLLQDRRPSEKVIGHVLAWYSNAAKASHAGICAIELKRLLLGCPNVTTHPTVGADIDQGILNQYATLVSHA